MLSAKQLARFGGWVPNNGRWSAGELLLRALALGMDTCKALDVAFFF